MTDRAIDLHAIRAARERIAGAAVRTPVVPLEGSDIWLKLEMLQPIGSFKIRGAANAMSAMSKTELAKGLDCTWQFMMDCLARWSPADMHQTFPDDWDGKQVDLSRAWVVWHVIEHDLHHGGELSLTLGMHGLPADFPG